ncbi:MAG TPA: polysaccharide deacetylase family protein [Gemmatimonadaceae bacterium]|jgi:peptidoglycan/xylan/chitin deacetylase (PgdA/CDA1 family)
MRAILTYHSIDSSGSVISTSEESFRRHVKWLERGSAKVVSVKELLKLGDDVDAVALTFDDGFANFAETASKVLADSGLTATVFVVTDCVGGTNSWEFRSGASVPLLPLMDWHQLSCLHELGFTIGAHTRTHANLSQLDSAELKSEISGSAERVASELGLYPEGFAYPFGKISPAAVREVSAGFGFACTTEFRPLSGPEPQHLLPRLDMYYFRQRGRLESFGTQAFARYVALRGRGRRLKSSLSRALRKSDG